jgi:hypothetical protein
MVLCMAQHAQHQRQPRGTPVGGQFATVTHPESPVVLDDQPGAKVHGQVSAYATALADDARRDAHAASSRVEALTAKAAELEAQVDAAVTSSASKGAIGRWSGRRKSKRARKHAATARSLASAATAQVEQATAEIGRLQAGIDAEQEVVSALAQVSGVRHVLCGVNLGPGVGDIDAIAVGAHAVVVEVKAGRGAVHAGADGTVVHGGRQSPGAPLAQAAKQAQVVRIAAGIDCTPVVCFPDAEPSARFHERSGCWLIGGTEPLAKFVAESMANHDGERVNAKSIVVGVQRHLTARQAEIQGWITSGEQKNRAAAQRIAKWRATIAKSKGWSKGAEIRANLTGLIAENQATVAERQQKMAAWSELVQRIDEARRSNERMLEGRAHPQ